MGGFVSKFQLRGRGACGQGTAEDPIARHRRLEGVIENRPDELREMLDELGDAAASEAVAYVGGPDRTSLWHAAVAQGRSGCFAELRRFGKGAIDAGDAQRRTPLHLALGWTQTATDQLLPALQQACLRDNARYWSLRTVGDVECTALVDQLRQYREGQLSAALPAALDYMSSRSPARDDRLVQGLLDAGANPSLSLRMPLPMVALGMQGEQEVEDACISSWAARCPEGPVALPGAVSSEQWADFAPLRMAVLGSEWGAIEPIFSALTGGEVSKSSECLQLLTTDSIMIEFANSLPQDTGMAKAVARTHRRFVHELWNRVRSNPETTLSMFMHLAEHHDRASLSTVLEAIERQAERNPSAARRNIDRMVPALGEGRFLTVLLGLFPEPNLIGRICSLGANATKALRIDGIEDPISPLALALGMVNEKRLNLQLLLEPEYLKWFTGVTEFDVGAATAKVVQQKVFALCAIKIRERPLDANLIRVLLDAGAPASEVFDLAISDRSGDYPTAPAGYAPSVAWPAEASALDVCAMMGATESVNLLLSHLSSERHHALVRTAHKRAGMVEDRRMQRLLAAFLR